LLVVALVVGCKARPSLEDVAAESGREFHVPTSVLLAAAYCESRLDPRPSEGVTPGWIKLVPWRPARDPRRAAQLLHVDLEDVVENRRGNVRGSAALLAEAASAVGLPLDAPATGWRAALERFEGSGDAQAGAVYAEQVLAVIAKGFRGRDDGGTPVVLEGAGTEVRASVLQDAARPPDVVGNASAPYWPAISTAHRPLGDTPRAIKYIVIHVTENSFATIFRFFRAANTKVASHYLIRSYDGLTIQMVDERLVAFHDACFNEESIGIEHEGFVHAGKRWFSDEMYRASAKLVRDIATRHGIPLDRSHILGHGETADCSSHTDPGPDWDWDKLMRFIAEAR